jgi:molybdopterin molybdotransferase
MTGAACPPGTEAVVPHEQVIAQAMRVVLPESLRAGQHCAVKGSECRAGTVVLSPGASATPLAIAALASFGVSQVRVIPRPRVAVITTGSELVPVDHTPSPTQIRDSNGPMLLAQLHRLGMSPGRHLHAADTLDAIEDALNEVADCDLVLLTGGVSVGRYDLVPPALANQGAEIVFHKVCQKPGKPLLFARTERQILFGLPGNPLAVHFCFERYVVAALRRLQGQPPDRRVRTGHLAEAVQRNPERTWFRLARVEPMGDGPEGCSVRPLPGSSSADIFQAASANAYLEIPPGELPLPAGTEVSLTPIA